MQNFFRWQHAQGGTLGPEGPAWPRVVQDPKTGKWAAGPSGAIQYALKHDPRLAVGAEERGGVLVPQPTQVLMEPGDAVFVMHATPHSGSHNSWTEPRCNIYFRLVHERRMAAHREKHVSGRSDHMVRGWDGEFLEAEDGLPPEAVYESTIASLLDHWSEWDGMAAAVAEGKARMQAEAEPAAEARL